MKKVKGLSLFVRRQMGSWRLKMTEMKKGASRLSGVPNAVIHRLAYLKGIIPLLILTSSLIHQ